MINIQPDFLRRIVNGKYPFASIPLYKENSIRYLNTEFERCKVLFKNRIEVPDGLSPQEFNFFMYNMQIELFDQIEKLEQEHKEELKTLAIKTIRKLYSIPEHINLTADLTIFKETCENKFKDEEVEFAINSEEQFHKLQDEIEKQIILNGLIQGSSIKIWSSIYFLIKDELDQINPLLINLYDKYSALTSISFWVNPIDLMIQIVDDGQAMSQGSCQVKDEETIGVVGNNLPVLLHELNKGAITYLTLHGLPANLTDQELDYVLSISNKFSHEIWHYLLSPTLWSDFLKSIDINSSELPKIIMDLSKLPYRELTNYLNKIIKEI